MVLCGGEDLRNAEHAELAEGAEAFVKEGLPSMESAQPWRVALRPSPIQGLSRDNSNRTHPLAFPCQPAATLCCRLHNVNRRLTYDTLCV